MIRAVDYVVDVGLPHFALSIHEGIVADLGLLEAGDLIEDVEVFLKLRSEWVLLEIGSGSPIFRCIVREPIIDKVNVVMLHDTNDSLSCE